MIQLFKKCALIIGIVTYFVLTVFLFVSLFMHGGLPWDRGGKVPPGGLPLPEFLLQLFMLSAWSSLVVALIFLRYRFAVNSRLTIVEISRGVVALDNIPAGKLKYIVNKGSFIIPSGIIFDEKNRIAHFVSCHCRNVSLIPQIFNSKIFSCEIEEIQSYDYYPGRDILLIATNCGICSANVSSRLPDIEWDGQQALELSGPGIVNYFSELGIPRVRFGLPLVLSMAFFIASSVFGLLAGAAFSAKYMPPGNSSIAMGCALGTVLFGSLSPLVFGFLKIKIFPILNFKLIVSNAVFFAAGSFVGLLVNLASMGPEGVGRGNLEMICGLAGLLMGLRRRR